MKLKRLVIAIFSVLVGSVILAIGIPWLIVTALAAGRTWNDAQEAESNDVAMVMGAAVWNGRPSPYLRGRLDQALALYRLGKAKVIIVSGSISDNEPKVMRQYLVENGVEPGDIVLDELGNDSYSSCLRAKESFGLSKLTVVSQSYHVPRTVAICRMLGLDAVGLGDRQPDTPLRTSYQLRELGANSKMIFELLVGRDRGIYAKADSVEKALASHR